MDTLTLIHNNSCSKSQCLHKFLTDNHIPFLLRDYLQHPLSASELKKLIEKIAGPAMTIVRQTEPAYKAWVAARGHEFLADTNSVIDMLVRHPQILQRPILIFYDRAVVGRPFEAAQFFLQDNGLI